MRNQVSRWLPALFMMLVIFLMSARSSSDLPNFNWGDTIVKKGGHVVGYALLALLYWRGFNLKKEKRWVAWLLAISYALTDEFHQTFVPGRHPSIWDVIIFDNVGSLISLWIASMYGKQKRSDLTSPMVEKAKQ